MGISKKSVLSLVFTMLMVLMVKIDSFSQEKPKESKGGNVFTGGQKNREHPGFSPARSKQMKEAFDSDRAGSSSSSADKNNKSDNKGAGGRQD